ncbi:hypothetical protein [Inediibacterium massiliense]|uniref:hypothetical protein n=1 Tax=Inediibacterium massiliense TaxID=1658111 RepID=UPI0018FE3F98
MTEIYKLRYKTTQGRQLESLLVNISDKELRIVTGMEHAVISLGSIINVGVKNSNI